MNSEDRRLFNIQSGEKKLLPSMEIHHPVGTRFSGIIREITDAGAILQADEGMVGVLLFEEMDESLLGSPSEILSIGQRAETMVLGFDATKEMFHLGLRQCAPPMDVAQSIWRGLIYPEGGFNYSEWPIITERFVIGSAVPATQRVRRSSWRT